MTNQSWRWSARVLLWVCACCVWLVPLSAWAQCQRLFQQAKYVDAAECMTKKARSFGKSKRFERGRWLRNAIKAWERAGAKSKDTAKAAAYREKAARLIAAHNKQKLYEDNQQRNSLRQERRRLLRLIGYASLVIISNHPKARICLKGFAYKRCMVSGLWSSKVRPGAYQISVLYPWVPPLSRAKSVTLKKREQKAILFRPPYVNVSIVTNDAGARMQLTGKALGAPLRGIGMLWTLLLPPGDYLLKLKYPHHPLKQRKFTIVRQQPKVLNFVKPPALPVLRIESQPPAAQVLINGKVEGKTLLALPLPAGQHRVELRKHCYLPIGKTIRTQPNKENALTVVLKRDPVFARWKARKDSERLMKVLGWVGVGVGIAAMGISVVAHFEASNLQSSAIADLREDRVTNFDQFKAKGQSGNTLRSVGYVSLGAGAVLAGFGLFGLLYASPGPLNALDCKVKAPTTPKPKPDAMDAKANKAKTTIEVTTPSSPMMPKK